MSNQIRVHERPRLASDSSSERRRWLVLAVTVAAQLMVTLDLSVVNVALPAIRSGLHFSAQNLQWVVNAYTITFAGFLLLGGRAADLLGRRATFVAGLVVFSAASLAGGLAPSEGMLIAARALQGLGGAIVAPASLAIITTTFEEGPQRNRAIGVWGAMQAPVAPPACCSAASSPSCSAGDGSCSSTSRSGSWWRR